MASPMPAATSDPRILSAKLMDTIPFVLRASTCKDVSRKKM
jgi:hypothetical protein